MLNSVFEDPASIADLIAVLSFGEPKELQEILESLVIEERLRKAVDLIKKELANSKVQFSISKEVEQRLSQKQREYFLMEQLKIIKKELGMESDAKEKVIEQYKAKAQALQMPEHVAKVFEEVRYCSFFWIHQLS